MTDRELLTAAYERAEQAMGIISDMIVKPPTRIQTAMVSRLLREAASAALELDSRMHGVQPPPRGD